MQTSNRRLRDVRVLSADTARSALVSCSQMMVELALKHKYPRRVRKIAKY